VRERESEERERKRGKGDERAIGYREVKQRREAS
jgi:hypothetical protein